MLSASVVLHASPSPEIYLHSEVVLKCGSQSGKFKFCFLLRHHVKSLLKVIKSVLLFKRKKKEHESNLLDLYINEAEFD